MCCFLDLIKESCLLKAFVRTPNLDDSISLPACRSWTNLKLHNASLTPKLVKKVITNLNSSKVSSRICIPVVVLKNCVPELLYILAEIFNMCLKESCLPDCWKILSVVPVFKNFKSSYCHVSLLVLVSKVGSHCKTCKYLACWSPDIFSFFQYGFRSSWSTADFLTVRFDSIARAFKRSLANRATVLDVAKVFDRVWCAGLLDKRKYYGTFQVRYLTLFHVFSVIDGFCWFWLRILLNNIQLMLVFLEAPSLVLHFAYYALMSFLIMLSVIFLSMVMMLLWSRYLIFDNN